MRIQCFCSSLTCCEITGLFNSFLEFSQAVFPGLLRVHSVCVCVVCVRVCDEGEGGTDWRILAAVLLAAAQSMAGSEGD